jgi:membrane protein YqaA with SNARE-associated domain
LVATVTVLASTLGFLINFSIFYIIAKFFAKSLAENENFITSTEFIAKYQNYILPISAVSPYGKFISIFFGLSRINFFKFALFVVIYRSLHFLYISTLG